MRAFEIFSRKRGHESNGDKYQIDNPIFFRTDQGLAKIFRGILNIFKHKTPFSKKKYTALIPQFNICI